MVTVTQRAATELQEVLKSQNVPQDRGVKLVPGDNGRIEMTIDQPATGDEITEHDGQPLLIVDSSIVDVLQGAEVDFESDSNDGSQPARFTIRPPGS